MNRTGINDEALSVTKEPLNQQAATTAITDPGKRRFFKGLSLLVGGAAATQLLGGNAIPTALAYTPRADSTSSDGKVLSRANLVALRAICAQVIPKTDTDGAAEVDAHGFVDDQLFHCYRAQDHRNVTAILAKIDAVATARYKQGFAALNGKDQLALLIDLEQPANEFDAGDKSSFKFLKGQIVFGYYTSEVGASKELKYLYVPGGFKGSIPYDSVGSAWGSMRSYF